MILGQVSSLKQTDRIRPSPNRANGSAGVPKAVPTNAKVSGSLHNGSQTSGDFTDSLHNGSQTSGDFTDSLHSGSQASGDFAENLMSLALSGTPLRGSRRGAQRRPDVWTNRSVVLESVSLASPETEVAEVSCQVLILHRLGGPEGINRIEPIPTST
jgi:hypothetical protein